MTCPTCGGVVEDHVCTTCGAAVWPDKTAGPQDGATPPSPPSAGTTPPPPPSAGQAATEQASTGSTSGGPTFVNPPASVPPPPPPRTGTPAVGGWQPSTPVTNGSSGSTSNALWWILGGVGVLAVLGVVAVALVLRSADVSLGELENVGNGSPERLALLWENCEAGDMQACDDLYLESPIDSPEEAFGDTCGNRNEPSGWCVDIHGEMTSPG